MKLKFKVFHVNESDKEQIPAEKDSEHHYYNYNDKRRQACSPLGSENEIESQLPQMKSIVMDPKNFHKQNLSDHNGSVNAGCRLGIC
jgi:hypothetical protein